ncbi:MAG: NAD(P)/FAD-dependent oxidoreductase [Bacteroidetes bacterium]|nr:NAD(P)/FAD-dependent oxidoreductase [Bacteroidota bacterium]
MHTTRKKIVVIGGGAAGFFSAITCAELYPDYQVAIVEQSSQLLQKVKISGGGRCNVTHYCFDVKQLVKNYPRGEKQLIGPFMRFNPANTFDWFELRGVELKAESDGRCFPVTDCSQTIMDCFLREAHRLGISIFTNSGVDKLIQQEDTSWEIHLASGNILNADVIIMASGSSLRVWKILQQLGHTIVPPVPSLFTFNIKDPRLKDLQGLAVSSATVKIGTQKKLTTSGPLLITHWGMSGPAILRLSAWGARALAAVNHKFEIEVNWCADQSYEAVKQELLHYREHHARKAIVNHPMFHIPRRLWERLTSLLLKNANMNFADLSNRQIEMLAQELVSAKFTVTGKSTYKDEFVTAGGVDLGEVDFKTMQSRLFPHLYFAGEVLDIDAITGGFNFQAAWTTGFIAGNLQC